MLHEPIGDLVDINDRVKGITQYANMILCNTNDHVIRVAVMTEPYHWHRHPNSDETFLVIEGSIYIDLEGKTLQLFPGQLFTVPKNLLHRTRPHGNRSVNVTIEKQEMETVAVEI